MAVRLVCLLLLLLPPLVAGSATAQESDITIYRCTDASGHLTVQDSPCAEDQSQQVRRMIQPADPPPRVGAVEPTAPRPASDPHPQPVVVLRAPRPMYECVRDDGTRYVGDDGDGNPRWIPTGWSYYDGLPRRRPGIVHGRGQAAPPATPSPPAGNGGNRASHGNGAPQLRFRSVDTPPRTRPPPGHGRHGRGFDYGYGGGMWVRDDCHRLPQAEVCARLRDRREEIRTRFFNAQANERATLDIEERGINARLSEDCGGA